MNISISSIYFSPVKSISFQKINKCEIKKNIGIINDRLFAFSRLLDSGKAQKMEQEPGERKLINFLTLKNTPMLNKYSFEFNEGNLELFDNQKKLISILFGLALTALGASIDLRKIFNQGYAAIFIGMTFSFVSFVSVTFLIFILGLNVL